MRRKEFIKVSALSSMPREFLRALAVSLARDIDAGADDKRAMLETVMVAVMEKTDEVVRT